ncbi:MAG TPA: fibronectin type III domain-containing protein [Candidatus Omnitrophota bacterium]|nr:fibronectin type III domain-containing protein [Candidatus Omnitrophota bacterium]HPD84716.1 fibronectin type III domain-containing protein [Candidatus Omnitrophota bacterium]HRZ03574.1 fibronectin type III domain-containing protein [Candidatus Omnitrophota bacterium]
MKATERWFNTAIIFSILSLVFILPQQGVYAQTAAPQITSAAGSFVQNASVVITGSGFGVKNPAEPLKWDGFESGVIGQRVGNGWYTERRAGDYPLYSDEKPRGLSLVSVKQDYTTPNQYNCNFGLYNPSGSTKYFVSFHMYAEIDPTAQDKSRNFKLMSLRQGGAGDWGVPGNYAEFRHDMYPINGSGHSYFADYDNRSIHNNYTNGYALMPGAWHHYQYFFKANDEIGVANAYYYRWLDGELKASQMNDLVQNRTASAPLWTNVFLNGYYARDNCTTSGCPANFWVSDVYIDTTAARVEVCEGSAWNARGNCEMQIPSAWNNNSLQIMVKQGALASGTPKYLYVVNENEQANQQGFPVTFGGSGNPPPADTIAPLAPANLIASPVSSSQINLFWSPSTDNVGVVGYNVLRSVTAGGPYAQIANVNTNTYQNTELTANTAYYYTVVAYDAAGNVSAHSSEAQAVTPQEVSLPASFNPWCSALSGIVDSALSAGQYNAVADINNDNIADAQDNSLLMTMYNAGDDTTCQAQFTNAYDQSNYLNVDWCNGLFKGIQDYYSSAANGQTNFPGIFDLNHDGRINLTDIVIMAQRKDQNDRAACFANYGLVLPPVPAGNQKIIFLHHSTGGNLYNYSGGGVAGWISNYNSTNGTGYQVSDLWFPASGSIYGGVNYPFHYWDLWGNQKCRDSRYGAPCLDDLTQNYDVIIFKHCFPASGVVADTGNPNINSSVQSLENYKTQYRGLRNLMDQYPAKKFIIWTLPPRHRLTGYPDQAARATEFSEWLKTDFLTENGPHANISVFDFRGYITDSNAGSQNFNYIKYEYELSHTTADGHPNSLANRTIGPIFAQFIVGAINGTNIPVVAASQEKSAAVNSKVLKNVYRPIQEDVDEWIFEKPLGLGVEMKKKDKKPMRRVPSY